MRRFNINMTRRQAPKQRTQPLFIRSDRNKLFGEGFQQIRKNLPTGGQVLSGFNAGVKSIGQALNPFSDVNKADFVLNTFLAGTALQSPEVFGGPFQVDDFISNTFTAGLTAAKALSNAKKTIRTFGPKALPMPGRKRFRRNRNFNSGSGTPRRLAQMRHNEREIETRIRLLERAMRDRPMRETKTNRVKIDPAACTTSGGMDTTADIVVGPGDDQRIGRKIKIKIFDWQWTLERGATTVGTPAQQVRMIIFVDTQNIGLAPDITGKNGLLAENTVSSMYSQESFPRFVVLIDKLYVFSTEKDPVAISDGGRINMRGAQQFFQADLGDVASQGKGSIWVFCKKFQGGVTPSIVLKTQFQTKYLG